MMILKSIEKNISIGRNNSGILQYYPDVEITLSWAKVQQRISELIDQGRYLPDAPFSEKAEEEEPTSVEHRPLPTR
jgi:hypothetical protein